MCKYGGLGDRHQQNGVNYTLDLNAGLTQVLSDGTNTYLYGNGRISQHATQTEYFLGDALGSVRQLADTAGAVTLTQSYSPYGETISSVGSGVSVYQFTGESRDANGLTYLRARYYNSSDGRFLTRDTWNGDYNRPLSLNRWGYVEGNPVNLVDPSGHYAYNRMRATNYAINWDNSSTSALDSQYDFTGNKCYEGVDFENQCTLFASFVLHHGGVEDPRIDPYKDNGLLDDASLYYWSVGGLKQSNYYSDQGCQYQPYTAIRTPDFYEFATTKIGVETFSHKNPPYYNENKLYTGDRIDKAWEDKLATHRGQIRPGDLVFYDIPGGVRWDHVAVIVGWGMPTTFGRGQFNLNEGNNLESVLQWVYSFTCTPGEESLPSLRPSVVDRSGAINYQYWRSLDNTSGQVNEIAVVHIENR